MFFDLESGIVRFVWSVGSQPGYDDVMAFTDVGDVECAISDVHAPLDLNEGHAYYITIRVNQYITSANISYNNTDE